MSKSPGRYNFHRDAQNNITGYKDNHTGKSYQCTPIRPGSRDLQCVAQKDPPPKDGPLKHNLEPQFIITFDEGTDEPIVLAENSK